MTWFPFSVNSGPIIFEIFKYFEDLDDFYLFIFILFFIEDLQRETSLSGSEESQRMKCGILHYFGGIFYQVKRNLLRFSSRENKNKNNKNNKNNKILFL